MKVKTKVILSLVNFAIVAVNAAKEIYVVVNNNNVALAEIDKEIKLAEINKEIALAEISKQALLVAD